MGACYLVTLKFNKKDGTTEKDISNAIESFIRKHDGTRCHFNPAGIAKLDGDLLPALNAILPEVEEQGNTERYENRYIASFDASYGWINVIEQAFENIAEYFVPGSQICILPDIGRETGRIADDGTVTWHWYDI